MRSLSTEEKLVLLLSQVGLKEDELNNEILAINEGHNHIDCNKILHIAYTNGVTSVIYKNIQTRELFPDQFEHDLSSIYHQISSANQAKRQETLTIINLLNKHSIKAIPLKGAIASQLVFDDLGLYPSGDIDILVTPSQLEKTSSVLQSYTTYKKDEDISEADLSSSHYHLLYRSPNYLLEVHWNLVKRYFTIQPDFWWENTSTIELKDTSVACLEIEKLILYLIFRLFDHRFAPLKFFALLGGTISKHSSEIQWQTLLDYAEKFGMKKLVLFTLQLTEELQPIELPELITKPNVPRYDFYKDLILAGIFDNSERQHLRMFGFSFLLDSPTAILKILSRRLFPPKGELKLRYQLPENSPKIYLYYLLNPFLLFFKKVKR